MAVTATDTIAAIATPPGRGGVGIVRISGPDVTSIVGNITGRDLKPRYATLCDFHDADGSVIDSGIAIYFPAPYSYTGEDILELHGHGGQVVMDCLLKAVLSQGARLARPGEFTERAYLNDKLDLSQAEAVADIIDAGSAESVKAAQRSLQGDFSRRISTLLEHLIQTRMMVEAAIDFPEEEIDFLAEEQLQKMVDELERYLSDILEQARQGAILKEGMQVVLAGAPNVGKSSLLNALSGEDTAIVTDIPGTTRDVLKSTINLDGVPLHIIDTAGLRENPDIIEAEGQRRARAHMERSDLVLLLVDDREGVTQTDRAILASLPGDLPVLVIHNKIDLTGIAAGVSEDGNTVRISVLKDSGLDALKAELLRRMGYVGSDQGIILARRRHLDLLQQVNRSVKKGIEILKRDRAGELMAEELRQAQRALNEITGEFTSDDLLGEIFSSFCIGK